MASNEAGLENRKGRPDEWGDGETRGDKPRRAHDTIHYGCISQPIGIHRKAEIIPVSA